MIRILALACVLILTMPAFAHFGMVIPSDSMITQGEPTTLSLELSFSHPFERQGMDMAKPEMFGVLVNGEQKDLTGTLKPTPIMGHDAFTATWKVERPGVHTFFDKPQPYWEPAENCFIEHYTKTVVAAFGEEDGWDAEVGLPTEIIPLARPFGLYAGNVFQGVVKLFGKPVPYATVEVEYYNRDGRAVPQNDYMVAQTVKSDSNGVFTYAAPRAGWWGFAALNTSPEKRMHDGEEKDVEMGAVLWVEFVPWKESAAGSAPRPAQNEPTGPGEIIIR